MYTLEKLHPIHLDDLIRVGKNNDGGYVLSSRQVENTEILLSFGINHEWSFEADFLRLKKAELYAFDHSVSLPILKKLRRDHFIAMLKHLLIYNKAKAKLHRMFVRYASGISHDFKEFFQEKKQRHFISKFVGECDDKTYVRLDTVMKNLPGVAGNLSVFIKMDVEGWEYRTLFQLPPFFDKINGMTVEFHDLSTNGIVFENIIKYFSNQFHIAHVHANNYDKLIENTNLPRTIEVTFINRAMISDPVFSSRSYPVKDLDFPCNEKDDDIILPFTNPSCPAYRQSTESACSGAVRW
jgi:hypothetical protein